jgi:hypothetical protein
MSPLQNAAARATRYLMDVAFAYLVDRRGAAFALELTHSSKVRDSVAREMARKVP